MRQAPRDKPLGEGYHYHPSATQPTLTRRDLLLQRTSGMTETETAHTTSIRSQAAEMLEAMRAAPAPPSGLVDDCLVQVDDTPHDGVSEGQKLGGGQTGDAVEINLVAGVFEERSGRGSQLDQCDGVYLPTKNSLSRIKAEEQQEAHALVALIQALGGGDCDVDMDDTSSSSSDGEGVAVSGGKPSLVEVISGTDGDDIEARD